MRLCSIASGSSGNCIYAGTDTTHVLVDAGISGKRVENGLNDIGLTGRDIDAILITHEHIDHIAGLGVLSRRYGIPIYTTEKTADAIQETKSVGKIPEELFHPVCAAKNNFPFSLSSHSVTIQLYRYRSHLSLSITYFVFTRKFALKRTCISLSYHLL